MKIRKAELRDIKNISTLAVQVWLDTYAIEGIRDSFSDYIWNELCPDNFQKRMANPDREIFVVEEKNHLVGIVELNYNSICGLAPSCVLEIEKFYIQENYCGNGIGLQLMEFIISLCKKRMLKSVWLSVYEKNERALRFYEKLNFKNIGKIYFNLASERHLNYVLTRDI